MADDDAYLLPSIKVFCDEQEQKILRIHNRGVDYSKWLQTELDLYLHEFYARSGGRHISERDVSAYEGGATGDMVVWEVGEILGGVNNRARHIVNLKTKNRDTSVTTFKTDLEHDDQNIATKVVLPAHRKCETWAIALSCDRTEDFSLSSGDWRPFDAGSELRVWFKRFPKGNA